ncbi:MAG: hypothetical protein JWQ66_2617 [Mucilaginibacter sp.]|nr:hypothetical protein [Mucilaginibacter sp.]
MISNFSLLFVFKGAQEGYAVSDVRPAGRQVSDL